ncbi:hypothetical protein JCM10207_000632 [Rhodosporidiobolus poonsookiae]
MSSLAPSLQRGSSIPAAPRPSSARPKLPSISSWSPHILTHRTTLQPPTSAGSTSSIDQDEAVTPPEGPPPSFPPIPTSLKMPSPHPPQGNTAGPSSASRTHLSSFTLAEIPPFRGAPSRRTSTSSPDSQRPSTSSSSAYHPSALPSAVSHSHTAAEPASRRASVASVFSLPRPSTSQPADGRGHPSGLSRSHPAPPVATGLGIEGVGVGHGGVKEALVIERLGETSGANRRGSLKRVLHSDDDEDSLRALVRSRDGDRSRMEHDSVPLPLQQPPALHHRASVSPLASSARRAGSSSPQQPPRHSPTQPHSQPHKRPRKLSPLDSLATTATELLGRPSTGSSSASSSTFVLGHAVPASAEQAAALDSARAMREQQQREIDRRRGGPPPGPLEGAFGKLEKIRQAVVGSGAQQAQTRPGSREGEDDRPTSGSGGSSFGKRRGHRPAPVNTASSGSSAGGSALGSARALAHPYHLPSAGETTPRSAALEIPSVLVGSPVDPSFAARAAREIAPGQQARAAGAAGVGAPAGAQPSSAGPMRRHSRSVAMRDGERERERERERDERPLSSSAGSAPHHLQRAQQQQQQQQPPLVSSSTYYIRPNQPLGPGVPFPSATASGSTPTSATATNKALPPAPAPAPGPPPKSAGTGRPVSPVPPTYHPLQQPGSAHYAQAHHPHAHSLPHGHPHGHPHAASHLPPRSATTTRASPSVAAAQIPSSAPPGVSSHAHPHASGPLTGGSSASSASSSSSKQAFLSLFSTFYDSLSDSRILTSSLEGHISRAAQLLNTLQQAEGVLERIADERAAEGERRVEERMTQWEGRLGRLEERVGRVERLAGAGAGAGEKEAGGAALQARRGSGESAVSSAASAVEERLERIERALASQSQEAAPAVVNGGEAEKEGDTPAPAGEAEGEEGDETMQEVEPAAADAGGGEGEGEAER